MRDRHGIEAATGAAVVGMMADDALIAVVHYSKGTPLSQRDQDSLAHVRDVLAAIGQLSARAVAAPGHLRSMAPLGVLDETFQAVASARGEEETGDAAAMASRLQAAIEGVLSGEADPETVEHLRGFLDRLADITLVRTEELARPGREQRSEWIKTVSPS